MFQFIKSWKEPEKITEPESEIIPKFLHKSNEIFKAFLNNYSWPVYLIAGVLIVCCLYYYISDCRRRLDLRRRRNNFQMANERVPQRRRPGAIYREHEIFRNAIKKVRQYIGCNGQGSKGNSLVLKRTRSGVIYGSYTDNN